MIATNASNQNVANPQQPAQNASYSYINFRSPGQIAARLDTTRALLPGGGEGGTIVRIRGDSGRDEGTKGGNAD